jgi:hypothetical protein
MYLALHRQMVEMGLQIPSLDQAFITLVAVVVAMAKFLLVEQVV